jgi:hypothetical protein
MYYRRWCRYWCLYHYRSSYKVNNYKKRVKLDNQIQIA